MATFKRKSTEEVQAIQFTGNNLKTVQTFAGERYLDRNNLYPLPRFDAAENWLDYINPDYPAVLWSTTAGGYVSVPKDAWIVKDGDSLSFMTDEDFKAIYETDAV